MKKTTLLIAFSVLLTAYVAFAGDMYFIDKNHSNMGFLIRHLFTKVPGRFTDFSGQINFDEANPEQSTVEVTIKTASVNTDNDERDKDLRSRNFFDVESFPEMTFRSKSVKGTGQNTFEVTGDLTMHGVTKEVTLKVEFTGKGKGAGPQGTIIPGRDLTTMVTGWDATTTVQRSDFGMTWNQMIEGTRVVADDVKIELRIEAESLLRPRELSPALMINTLEENNGVHPGFRRVHAKGVCVTGYFESNGRGVALSKASVFLSGRVPIIGRFSLQTGQPYLTDAPDIVRGMAILFKLPGGEEWRTGMINTPVFNVNTPEALYDLLLTSASYPETGKPDPARMQAFLAKHPESAKAMQLIRTRPVSSGFENSTFNSLDAFRFINAIGTVVPVRWSMVPGQPFEPVSTPSPGQADKNYLFDSLIASIHNNPLQWDLIITVGQPGDPTNDATVPWPPDRQRIDVGTLTIDHVESEDTSPGRDINFDPLVLPNGITASDDPLLSARSAAYSQSFTRREGEHKEPSAVSPTETGR
ncbi:MAG: YceI family protein [Verrucomicrobia bacterium]|nr:YceI family protein [Verrucomicrobiota bacterium]